MLLADAKPVAALPAVEDEDMETPALSVDSTFLDLNERSRRRREMVGDSSIGELRLRLGLMA
jgi:hypothetical protein